MIAAGLAFAGALIGAGIPALISLRGQRQEARTEWSHRLDSAVEALSSSSPGTHAIGQELLADLISSNLGSAQDRDLARRLARINLDESGASVDNDDEQSKERT